MEGIEHRRARIREIDREIVDLIEERMELARMIGREKVATGLPIRNYAVEAEVLRLVEEECARRGLRPRVGVEVVKLLIEESLRVQEVDRRRATRLASDGHAGKALIVGGRGNMGVWFAEFLDSKGYAVHVADPRGAAPGTTPVADWEAKASEFKLILVATPPSAVSGVLRALRGKSGAALVADIGSLKSPFLDELEALARSGARVTSLHPMWGPATDLLASKNLLVCSVGVAEADAAARALFADTAANVVDVPAREHDAFMAFTLTLPHALSLVFGRALAKDAPPITSLAPLGGPTFTKQVRVAAEVAGENKDLYYEIQRLNDHTSEVYASLRRALDEMEKALADRERFRALMREAEAYFKESP